MKLFETGHLIPEVEAAVNKIMHYDGISNVSTMLMLNNPSDMQNKMKVSHYLNSMKPF